MKIPAAPEIHFEVPDSYLADLGTQPNIFSWAALYALDTACSLLGCRHAWVARHSGSECHIVMTREQTMTVDAELQEMIVRQAHNASAHTVETAPWWCGMLLFLGLSDGLAADGRKYVLGLLMENDFEMTERRAGVLDGLRCSLQRYLRRLQPDEVERSEAPADHPVACSCCRRVHTNQHGWMHWDELRLLKTGRGTSHTVCEKCADMLYSDVLQNGMQYL